MGRLGCGYPLFQGVHNNHHNHNNNKYDNDDDNDNNDNNMIIMMIIIIVIIIIRYPGESMMKIRWKSGENPVKSDEIMMKIR